MSVTIGGKGGEGLRSAFLKIGKMCHNLGKKWPDCGHLR